MNRLYHTNDLARIEDSGLIQPRSVEEAVKKAYTSNIAIAAADEPNPNYGLSQDNDLQKDTRRQRRRVNLVSHPAGQTNPLEEGFEREAVYFASRPAKSVQHDNRKSKRTNSRCLCIATVILPPFARRAVFLENLNRKIGTFKESRQFVSATRRFLDGDSQRAAVALLGRGTNLSYYQIFRRTVINGSADR